MRPFLAIMLLCLFSCSNDPKKEEKQTTARSGLKQEQLSILHGGWLKKDYVEALQKTHSPMESFKNNEAYLELIIDTTNTIGDTITNPGCLANGKEGYYFSVILGKDSLDRPTMRMQYNIDYTGESFFLDYEKSSADTLLYLIITYPNSDEIKSKTAYRRIYRNPPGNDYSKDPTNVFLNRTLMQGTYKVTDAHQKPLPEVVFHENGSVEGFSEYTHYYVESYYGNVRRFDFDYLMLSSPGKIAEFKWVIENDLLKLYEIVHKNDAVQPGQLKYILKRK